jgi:hypothetical protein
MIRRNFRLTEPPSHGPQLTHQTVQRLANLRSELSRTLVLTIGLSVVTVGGVLFVFWPQVKEFLGQSGAELTTKSLQDAEVKKQAAELSKQVLQHIMDDPATLELLRALLLRLTRDPATREVVDEFVLATAMQLIADPRTRDQFAQLILVTFQRDDIRAAAGQLAAAVVRDDQRVFTAARDVAADIVRSDAVRASSVELVDRLLHERRLRTTFGHALNDAAWIAVTPSIFRRTEKSDTDTAESETVAVTETAKPPPPEATKPADPEVTDEPAKAAMLKMSTHTTTTTPQ